MVNYLTKRILLFVFTIFLFTVIGFVLTTMIPGDPTSVFSDASASEEAGRIETQNQQQYIREQMGLNLPLFYLSFGSLSDLKNPQLIADKSIRKALEKMSWECGTPLEIIKYYNAALQFDSVLQSSPRFTNETKLLRTLLTSILTNSDLPKISTYFKITQRIIIGLNDPTILSHFTELNSKFRAVSFTKKHWKSYVPIISFHSENRYHRWVFGTGSKSMPPFTSKGIIRGDFGYSYLNGEPIGTILYTRVGWSVALSLTAILLAFAIGILIANLSLLYPESLITKYLGTGLFLLYSIPTFVFATLLLYLFANPTLLNWFPASGIAPIGGYPSDTSAIEKIFTSIHYLLLPLITYVYGIIAYIYRLLKLELQEEMDKDYITTARAKGISESSIILKHAFKNASFSMITLFSNIFPYTIAGSVIIETIFTLPGMGYELYQAVLTQNYPLIIAFFTMSGIVTLFAFWLSDLLYVLVNPKLKHSSIKND